MSIKAMKLALEWIEAQPEPRMIGAFKIITALRQAIEQSTEQEPVAWELRKGKTDRVLIEITNNSERAQEWKASLEEVVPLYSHTQINANPVAWIYQNLYTEDRYLVWSKQTGGRNWQPLYTAPPQRKPLTDEEIEKLMDIYDVASIDYVRAIEAAHGIKGEE